MVGKILGRMAKDWFLAGMVSAVALAVIFPEFGSIGGAMHAEQVSNWGIFMIFLLHGLALSTEHLRRGMSRWKLHVLVQALTYVVFPLLYFPFRAAFGGLMPAGLLLGFLYLCALPSTVSSSVAMTAIARGNVPAAIFNATLSSLLGIVLTPSIVELIEGVQGTGGLSFSHAVTNIALMLLLPFVLGQALRPVFGKLAQKYKKWINTFDKLVILVLVYGTFCDSVKSGLWTHTGLNVLVVTLGGTVLFLGLVLCLSSWLGKKLGLPVEDRITAVFCGSKKTLASGVPMARLIFGANPALGLIVLPIMFYHPLQLFVCSVLAARYARRDEAAAHGHGAALAGSPALEAVRVRS